MFIKILYVTAFENEARVMDGADLTARTKDLNAMVPYWDQTDAIVEGYKAVRDAGEAYLPKFAKETDDEYNNRLKMTKYTNVYRDIVEGLATKPFEEEVTLIDTDKTKPDQRIVEFVEDVDGYGNNITVFLSQTFFNGINSAIDWIFIDYPKANEKIKTKADQKAFGIAPFWSHVLGRNVLEVRTRKVGKSREISYIRVLEPSVDGVEKNRVRIMRMNEETGVIEWELWVETDDRNSTNTTSMYVLEESGNLSIDMIPMVPFITGRRDGASWRFYPAMQDAADLQIELYQEESALKFISIMAGYPMLSANGVNPEMMPDGITPKPIAIGPARVLYGKTGSDGKAGSWQFIEPSAQSMEFLQKRIDATKQDLRELGRQPLTATSGQLTTITTAVAAGKSKSAVGAWTLGLKDAAENALLITAKYMSLKDHEPSVNIYNEFDNYVDNNTDQETLLKMREAGDLSQTSLWTEMKRRKVLSPEFNDEIEREELLKEVPNDDSIDPLGDDDNKGQKPLTKEQKPDNPKIVI